MPARDELDGADRDKLAAGAKRAANVNQIHHRSSDARKGSAVEIAHMAHASINMAPEPPFRGPSLKPFLLLTLALAVLSFCTTLLVR